MIKREFLNALKNLDKYQLSDMLAHCKKQKTGYEHPRTIKLADGDYEMYCDLIDEIEHFREVIAEALTHYRGW